MADFKKNFLETILPFDKCFPVKKEEKMLYYTNIDGDVKEYPGDDIFPPSYRVVPGMLITTFKRKATHIRLNTEIENFDCSKNLLKEFTIPKTMKLLWINDNLLKHLDVHNVMTNLITDNLKIQCCSHETDFFLKFIC